MANKIKRRKTNKIFVGNVPIGGGSPIAVQSMTKTDTRDPKATLRQIRSLAKEGCEIIRVAVPDSGAASALGAIVSGSPIPVIADIHFDWRLALEAVKQGVRGLRINPGNIGARWKLREVVSALRGKGIPLRVGVNAGSLEKDLLKKYGRPAPEALVESAERSIALLEECGFDNIKISLKASSVTNTVNAYELFSKKHRYPLHVGISEAGPMFPGLIKSSVGLGLILSKGIGDTIRVSLTAKPEAEVRAAYGILRALGLRDKGVEIVSCPTCGRCGVDLRGLIGKVEGGLSGIKTPITVAIMGCAVNGPGEAREADVGIAAGKGMGIIFKGGSVKRKVAEKDMVKELLKEVAELCREREK